MSQPTAALVTLRSASPRITLTALLGPNGGVPTEGYGGWNVVDRPRRQGLTIWGGRSPFKMDLQLVIDDFRENGSVEVECSTLERLALPPSAGEQPPVVTIQAAAVPHTDLTWVIDKLQWEDVERRADGKRIRQIVTVSLIRYVKETKLKEVKASARARAKAKAKK